MTRRIDLSDRNPFPFLRVHIGVSDQTIFSCFLGVLLLQRFLFSVSHMSLSCP